MFHAAFRYIPLAVLCSMALAPLASSDEGSVLHLPLLKDSVDVSAAHVAALPHNIVYDTDGGAAFNGRDSYIEVPQAPELGTGDFTIAAWIHTEGNVTDFLGDIASQFDPATRTGFNLTLQNFQGVASSQSNFRNLFFGIDAGTEPTPWRDRGRQGNAALVFALSVFDGALYAGTFEQGAEGRGRIFRLGAGDVWIDCGAPHGSNAITALAVHDGHLYAAASHYRSQGSALPEAENATLGGQIYRYAGESTWDDMGKPGEFEAVGGMVSFNGSLYVSSLYAPAGLFRMEAPGAWEACGNPGGRTVALTVHDGAILGSGYDVDWGGVYRYGQDKQWTSWGVPPETTQTYSFMTHYGKLYVGTWPAGKVFRHAGDIAWADEGQMGQEKEVMGMAVYNGKLYGGTLPLAEVYRFDGTGNWHNTGQLDTTPEVKYRRAWTMGVFDGQLFCGTLPSGKVFSMEAGHAVSWDKALLPGWQHITAVRRGDTLSLVVNGELVASRSGQGSALSLTNQAPLTIGFGAHDYFHGRIRDFRVYTRALPEEEIKNLSALS